MGYAEGYYEEPQVMLLSPEVGSQSGGGNQADGTGGYYWSLTWDTSGFTGQGWGTGSTSWYEGQSDDIIREDAQSIVLRLTKNGTTKHACAIYSSQSQ